MSPGADEIQRTRRDVSRTWDIVKRGSRGLMHTELPRMAAALSFRTLFGMIPILVLGLILIGSFATEEQVLGQVDRLLEFAGLSGIEIDSNAIDGFTFGIVPVGPGAVPFVIEAPDPTGGPTLTDRTSIDELIVALVQRVQTIEFKAIGFAGVVFLIYAALSMFVEMERAFNQICRAPRGRSWGRRFAMYWTMLTLGLILLLASFTVSQSVNGVVAGLGAPGFIVSTVAYAVTVCISALLLIILYTNVPNARVAIRAAAAGAFVGAVLWETGKWGFTRYLAYTANYVSFYGSIALLLLFMIWVQVTWLFVLFGLQVAYAFQHFDRFKNESHHEGPVVLDPLAMVRVAAEAAGRFAKGDQTDASDAAAACGIDAAVAGAMLEKLASAGVLRISERTDEDDPDRYSLARPAEAIAVRDLVALAELPETPDGVESPSADPGSPLGKLVAARLDAASGMTLADLARPFPGDGPKPLNRDADGTETPDSAADNA